MRFLKCRCGCGTFIKPLDNKYRKKYFVHGHNRRGLPSHVKPNSTNVNTGRWRAKKILRRVKCELAFTKQCKGRLEVHHKDENPVNNSLRNLSVLCRSHHCLIHSGQITYASPYSNEFYVDASGKRRYAKT